MTQTKQGGRVLIADDHPLTREGIGLAAKAAFSGVAVDFAGSVAEAEAALRARSGFRLILLDLMLPDAHGFSGLMQLQHVAGRIPIAMISAREDGTLVEAARALGAAGFLYKTRTLDRLVSEMREMAGGGTVFPLNAGTGGGEHGPLRDRLASLSGAQLRVLIALADGRLNKQIAGDLDVSEATVKAHMTAIFRKLGVTNRAQALLAVQPVLGDIAPDATAA